MSILKNSLEAAVSECKSVLVSAHMNNDQMCIEQNIKIDSFELEPSLRSKGKYMLCLQTLVNNEFGEFKVDGIDKILRSGEYEDGPDFTLCGDGFTLDMTVG